MSTAAPKRFRIQDFDGSMPLAPIRRDLSAGAGPDPIRREDMELARLTRELHAMREAIATTKRELGDLQSSPAGADGMHRAAGELDAVSSATEQATAAIIGAVEEIELSANLIRVDPSAAGRAEAARTILDRVLVLYESCNFQDIAGQRIRKVVTTLKFVEERMDGLIAAWDKAGAARGDGRPGPASGIGLLSGPPLPGEAGHVTQSDVDTFFP